MANDLFANGILADTGQPLPLPGDDAGQRIAATGTTSEDAQSTKMRDEHAQNKTFGLSVELDADDLSEAGWGIIFPADMDTTAIEQALTPLINRRRIQTTPVHDLFRIFKGPLGWRAGESATAWLARQGKSAPRLDVVNPRAGVPYYLMVVAPPDILPMSFQYTLDTFWAVGRLHFPTVEEYARYAKSVVDYETGDKPPQSRKQVTLFATEHPFDAATKMFTTGVARPFVNGDPQQDPLGKNQQFKLDAMLSTAATKDGLANLLRGKRDGGVPALLFSGSHGMEFRLDDQRQPNCQGALVCQDWKGFGKIDESVWFSAADLPADACIHGMVHFMFACYGGGWEKFDTFRTGPDGAASQIAPRASISRLPQAMLAHPNGGALAVIAHVDRAWSYSFTNDTAGFQSTGMRDVLTCIMMGMRLGHAMDQFNVRWAALSTQIADALRDFKDGKISGTDLARQWIMRDDARNYTILGDPAAKLRVDDMVAG
jgi:hypothetical protein